VSFYHTNNASLTTAVLSGNVCAGYGGGLSVDQGTNTLVQHSTFDSNVAGLGGGGIRDTAQYTASTIQNELFYNNQSTGGIGGGLYVDGMSPSIAFCTFTHNSAVAGGGIAHLVAITLSDSILWGDTQTQSPGTPWEHEIYSLTGYTISYCDIQNSSISPGIGTFGTVLQVLDVDPKFTAGTNGVCPNAPVDGYHLIQTANACVNKDPAGVPFYLTGRSTNPDHTIADTGNADLGFHYPGAGCP
jgi:hypothetical protein